MKTIKLKRYTSIFSILLLLCIILPNNIEAQNKKKNKKKNAVTAPISPKPKKEKTINDLVKSSKKIEGLFTIYQDTITGSLQMLVSEKQLNKDFIHFGQISDGVMDAGRLIRGMYGKSQIFQINKYFNKLEFIKQNTSFYFDPENAISKSKNANISNGNMISLKIEAYNKKDSLYLIKADDLFLKETFAQLKPSKRPGSLPTSFSLGNLDKSKTKIKAIKNYPENTDLEVEYVYSKSSTSNSGSNAIADGRHVSIKTHHSIIAIPENDYEVRYDDARVGYFSTQIDNKTSLSATPYKDLIHRWHLVKKDPDAEISEPITPITWWMENTTPKEIRPIIKKAGEKWNLAFEKAGFKNAVVIKQQPDDAEWDAGDIRYNVLRWTSSPKPPFGGYGPSFVNPKTGQILGADIMLEYASFGAMLNYDELFEKSALSSTYNNMLEHIQNNNHGAYCMADQTAKLNHMFGLIANTVLDSSPLEKRKIINERIHYLILHEMGHTLGLNHNMKSSQLHTLETINNEAITSKIGLMGSVMDYPAINFSHDRENQGQYYTTQPGPYDMWAIEFGYKKMSNTEMTELLSKSTQPELIFGNDADDMRAPGKAIDPRVNIYDLTNDAIQYSIDRIKLTNTITNELLTKYKNKETGNSYQKLRNSYNILTGQHSAAANTISRYIGGVYVDRSTVGQDGATQPYTPVSLIDQKKALTALKTYIFAPNAFNAPKELYNYLAPQRRGFNLRANEDPKIHSRILGIQKNILSHLLHPNTLQRITDSELYGNAYKLSAFMSDLNAAIFKADIYGNINSFRQNLQLEYTNTLIDMLTGKQSSRFTNNAKSMALYNLKSIKTMANTTGNISSKAHKQHLRTLIDNALKEVK
ncbi:MAG: zinc-dependent metalloprotease [Algibacter sp.]